MKLRINMRAKLTGDQNCARFAAFLLLLGNGLLPVDENETIAIPEPMATCVPTLEALKDCVFPNLNENLSNLEWVRDRAILAPRNETVREGNKLMLAEVHGESRVYQSIDTCCDPDQAVNFPTEYLNSLQISGMPDHILELKLGVPIMLLRNLGQYCAFRFRFILTNQPALS